FYTQIRDILAATDFDQKKLKVSLLTETITKQEEVGGVLVNDEAVFGFITVLSLTKHLFRFFFFFFGLIFAKKNKKKKKQSLLYMYIRIHICIYAICLFFFFFSEHLSLAHICRFLLDRCKDDEKKSKLRNYIDLNAKGKSKSLNQNSTSPKNVGMLFHERPINVPVEMIYHIYESLYLDIEYVLSDEYALITPEEKQFFKFDYLLHIVRYRWIPKQDLLPKKDNKNKAHGFLDDDENEEEEQKDELNLNATSQETLPDQFANTLLPEITSERKKETLVYEHFEDELFVKHAVFSYPTERNDKVWNSLLTSARNNLDLSQHNNVFFFKKKKMIIQYLFFFFFFLDYLFLLLEFAIIVLFKHHLQLQN
ncbi:hypothetical protein RFI_18755, partial [Reticulomyxa filosa]